MKLIEAQPKHPYVRRLVDRYQFYDSQDKTIFKSIPNGKVEAWITIEGSLEILDHQVNQFRPIHPNSFYPISNQITLFRIPEKLVCINLKLHPIVLGFPFFKNFFQEWQNLSTLILFSNSALASIQNLDFLQPSGLDFSFLDRELEQFFGQQEENEAVTKIIALMTEKQGSSSQVVELAKKMNMSTKTLERIVRKHFSSSPKDLWNIIRFGQTTGFLKNNQTQKLIEALAFGYYDQSHFTKECRRITGLPPTALFQQMKLPTNDLLFE